MRLFLATLLPPDDAAFYDAIVAGIVSRAPTVVRAIPRASAHLTHTFLGEVPAADVARVEGAIDAAVKERTGFDIDLGPPALLDAGPRPRLVMAPVVKGGDQLDALSQAIVSRLREQAGLRDLPAQKGAHVTLARILKTATGNDVDRLIHVVALPAGVRRIRVSSVQLVRSTLTPGGPLYDTLWTKTLRGRN